jgi:hypothetical protein
MADTPRNTRSGNAWFGSKDMQYLKKVSRQAIEKHTDTEALYLEIDYEKSIRNFYGELIVKKFVNPLGIALRGVINVEENDTVTLEKVPNKITKFTFSCYTDQLRELGVEPKIGDYFVLQNRYYMIWDKTISDAVNPVAAGRENLAITYKCSEADDEEVLPDLFQKENRGSQNDIEGTAFEPQE